jgi:hypothetical protein
MLKTTKKASSASKKVVAAKARRRSASKSKEQRMLAPGQEVRLPLRVHNLFAGYNPRLLREDVPSRQIEGLVLSIREIATGKMVGLAVGDFDKYVIEVIHNRSFDASFASTGNAGKATMGERPQNTKMWAKLKATLHQMGQERKLVSTTDDSFAKSALPELLDGWRVVKVRASEIEAVE